MATYILVEVKNQKEKNQVVDHIVEGEQDGAVPDDMATWAFEGKLALFTHVKKMQFNQHIS